MVLEDTMRLSKSSDSISSTEDSCRCYIHDIRNFEWKLKRNPTTPTVMDNMNSIFPLAFGTDTINEDVYATRYGETYIPFSAHIRPAPTPQTGSEFHPFLRLPSELQLYTLSFCDNAILFKLMQVCSMLREEAGKLFWKQPDVWHLIDGAWLLHGGGLNGDTDDNVDVLRFMQRVEVNVGRMEPFYEVEGEDDGAFRRDCIPPTHTPYTAQDRMRHIQDFWKLL
ncbi:hypothetical protein A1F94_002780 [Pyrenophora tritici-repentis]|uniref:F-box domain-containing protein n=3 Tax=Pyrenophora tritici-repentis TaxID=45151 RepID=A0A922NFH6_9PLEO|nr:hypothetical protein A1F94_002780 [Pyrenophora tritici-repentis]KAI1515042.1 hypothetical protein Ptr86124_006365 [Pyrenophora tritici-repentis]KAI1677422.1 hypothetical protein KJE20_13511 [Pyrenophora tritici-repentis]